MGGKFCGRKVVPRSCLIGWLVLNLAAMSVVLCERTTRRVHKKNAYATMMYMGTPRDYEFYVATRVMLRSLGELKVDADLVVIASMDVPHNWVQALLRWSVPCGPNSVVTFPGAPWLKPWYWWSWPVLPLGLQWHKQRLQTLGYGAEMPMVFIEAVFYIGIMAVARVARPNLSKLCYRREEKSIFFIQMGYKLIAIWSILAAYIVPFFLVPHTIHPLIGWSLYLLGAFSLSCIATNAFLLPMLPVLVPWIEILGTLIAMAYPWYPNGVVRALSVFAYSFCCSPILWMSFSKIMSSLQIYLEREAFLPRLGENASPSGFNKLY